MSFLAYVELNYTLSQPKLIMFDFGVIANMKLSSSTEIQLLL